MIKRNKSNINPFAETQAKTVPVKKPKKKSGLKK